jgi:hypothetical protein
MIVKRVGVLSVAKVYGALAASMGLLFGLILAAISTIAGGSGLVGDDAPAFLGAMFGAGAVIVLPIFYGCMGLVAGAIGAALYNLFAGLVGGVSIEVE